MNSDTKFSHSFSHSVIQEIFIGDWCLFWFNSELLIGLVLGFSRLHGKTYGAREHSRGYAQTLANDPTNPIGALCSYYRFNEEGKLSENGDHPFYLSTENYKATIKAPEFTGKCLRINNVLLSRITDLQGSLVVLK